MVGSDEDCSPSGYAITLEAAKAAAQADYAARIIAALDPAALASMLVEARAEGRKSLQDEIDAREAARERNYRLYASRGTE